jgi:hypothetical protein
MIMIHLLWVLAAGLLGFLITAFFAGRLGWSRSLLLVPYVILAGGFLFGYFYWSQIDLATHLAVGHRRRRARWGAGDQERAVTTCDFSLERRPARL